MQRLLFIDRDGTILREPDDEQIDSISKFRFVDGVLRMLPLICERTDYIPLLVSNQDGLGTSSFPEPDFEHLQRLMLDTLRSVGVTFKDIFIDCSLPSQKLPTHKPGIEMLTMYTNGTYDLAHSYAIGDRVTDEQLAQSLGCGFIRISQDDPGSWHRAADTLIHGERRATLHRKTLETDVNIDLNLNGTGQSDIHTGIGFFDHMLIQIARHAAVDLSLTAHGDLQVDCHHTIEDVAITLGQALNQALVDRRAIERYAFILPMDDSCAQVSIDLGGRADLLWDVTFSRDEVGNIPTEMWKHFFKSLSRDAHMNIQIRAQGEDNHHLVESVFKAFARCLRSAIRRDLLSDRLPSSKGVL